MSHQFVNYCIECEWIASTDEQSRSELSRLAVDHACSTGHDVAGERPDDDRDGSDRPPDRTAGSRAKGRTSGRRPDAMESTRPARGSSRRRVYSLSEKHRTGGNGHKDG